MFKDNYSRPITISELKYQLRHNEYLVKQDIELACYGKSFTVRLSLPATCFPSRGILCFEYGFDKYAMYFDAPITYVGYDRNMCWLCEGDAITFDCWYQLVNFCLSLPN